MFAIFLMEEMNPFYLNISSFPTVIFTVALVVATAYWLIAALGLIDINVLDLDIPEVDGPHAEGTPDASLLTGLMLKLGLQGIPVTIIVTLISMFGWLISYYLVHFLISWIDGGTIRFITGIPIFIVSLYLAVMITALALKPMRKLFINEHQHGKKYILGQNAVVRTSRVDSTFGEATLEDGGAGLILQVRTNNGEVFQRGDRVVLLEHLPEINAYRIISEEDFLNK